MKFDLYRLVLFVFTLCVTWLFEQGDLTQTATNAARALPELAKATSKNTLNACADALGILGHLPFGLQEQEATRNKGHRY